MSNLDQLGALLRMRRERAGLSQEVAADAVGINRVLLSYYEAGKRQVPLPTAVSLARLFGTSLEGLVGSEASEPATIPVSDILFRATDLALEGSAHAGLRWFERHARDFVDLAHELGRDLPGAGRSPFPAAAGTSAREASRLARDLRRQLNLAGGPVGDVFRVADEHVALWRLPLGADLSEAPSGLFYNHPQIGFCLVVNSDMTLGRQVFTAAHELGHAFFHSHGHDVVVSMAGRDHARERFADAFAGEFLVPGDELRRVAGDLAVWEDIDSPVLVVRLQRHFGVSFATIRVRMRQEKLISQSAFEGLGEVSPSRLARALGYDVQPADMGNYSLHPLDRFPAAMLSLVRTAVERGVITAGDAAETLGTGLEEVRQLLGRPRAEPGERRAQQDLEDAAFARQDP
ncbi:MAG: ImmA/IrrE family metallo-endopeptidase [Acidimicrobiia bacterium]